MTVLRESPAGIISQKFLWLQFYLLFQCLAPGVKKKPIPLWRWKKSCLMLLAGFYFASVFNMQNRSLCASWSPLAQFRAWQSLAGFLFDDFHCKTLSLCGPQDGCCVVLPGLSSAEVSMGFTSSAACQALLRYALGALLRGTCTLAESAWSH